jgi:hypothetical protein
LDVAAMIAMHDECKYYIANQDKTNPEADKSSTFDQPKLKLFKTYQKEFAHHLFMLRESPRLDPVEAKAYMSVPRILVSHTGAPRSAQSNKNYNEELSCKFNIQWKIFVSLSQEFSPLCLATLLLLLWSWSTRSAQRRSARHLRI